jgi:hypothetical protein
MRYYQALEKVQINHENEDFYQLILEHAEISLTEHLHLVGGKEVRCCELIRLLQNQINIVSNYCIFSTMYCIIQFKTYIFV